MIGGMSHAEFVALGLPPLVAGLLGALACALPGNFLLLRRQALIGDAISHVALPGIVLAFLLTGTISTWPMMLGAAAAALAAAAMIEAVRRLGRLEPGAAMGVVFTTLFAAGVVALELNSASSVHIDVEHALYGNLESVVWFEAEGWGSLLDPEALAAAPAQIWRMAGALALMALCARLFWKELALSAFDAGFAASVGARPRLAGAALTAATAVAAVAAFEAVGSVIVIAMFICPPAAARLMTDRLDGQVAWSLVFAAASAFLGWLLAGWGPGWLGYEGAVSAAGMIATVAGLIMFAACAFGPRRRGVAHA